HIKDWFIPEKSFWFHPKRYPEIFGPDRKSWYSFQSPLALQLIEEYMSDPSVTRSQLLHVPEFCVA
ncbi:hypothetical protein GJAV_G00027950, partial [Gymnothorax javanicus]